jgi:hypothetical protein
MQCVAPATDEQFPAPVTMDHPCLTANAGSLPLPDLSPTEIPSVAR